MFHEFSNRKRIVALEEAFEKLQRDFNSLKLEWADAPLPGILTPRMRTINAQIAARRQHLIQGGK